MAETLGEVNRDLTEITDKYAWGTIYLEDTGEIRHIINTSNSRSSLFRRMIHDAGSHLSIHMIRNRLKYQGRLGWRKINNRLDLEGMVTRERTGYGEARRLYAQFEEMAYILGVDYLQTRTSRPRAVMERLGWRYHESPIGYREAYRKQLSS